MDGALNIFTLLMQLLFGVFYLIFFIFKQLFRFIKFLFGKREKKMSDAEYEEFFKEVTCQNKKHDSEYEKFFKEVTCQNKS